MMFYNLQKVVFWSTLILIILFFTLFHYLVLFYFITFITMALIVLTLYVTLYDFRDVRRRYEFGHVSKWYFCNVKIVGENYMIDVFKLLEQKGLIKNKKLILLSPSANYGLYEKKLFRFLSEKAVYNKFLLSDISVVNHENNESNSYAEFIYLDGSFDAWRLQEFITEKADLIFDIKGCAWYCRKIFKSKEKNAEAYRRIFEVYSSVLNKDGLLIFDNFTYSWFRIFIYQFCKGFLWFVPKFEGERSTGPYLKKLLSSSNEFKKYVNENFEVVDLGNSLIFKKKYIS